MQSAGYVGESMIPRPTELSFKITYTASYALTTDAAMFRLRQDIADPRLRDIAYNTS